MPEKPRRLRGQVIPLGDRSFGVRVPLKERGRNGRHKTHYETLYNTTEAKAEKYKEVLLARIDAGLFFSPAPKTVSAVLDEWLEQKKRDGARHATLYTYGDIARNCLKPYAGHLMIGELTPLQVRDLYNALQDRGLTTATIRYARTVLNLALRAAVQWGYLKENPAEGIKSPPGAQGRELRCLNLDEARSLVECALLDPDDLVFAFALMTGLRPEEYLGLPHRDLSLVVQGGAERGLVRVSQVAYKVRGGDWIIQPPKTKKGVREVPFPAWLYREIGKLNRLTDSRRRAMGEGWRDFDLVFPGKHGAPYYAEDLDHRRFRPLLKRAGLATHFTLYSLRYTYATLQFIAGERDRVISDLMGHTSTDFTKQVYTKVLPSMREAASDSLERLISEGVRTTLAQPEPEHLM